MNEELNEELEQIKTNVQTQVEDKLNKVIEKNEVLRYNIILSVSQYNYTIIRQKGTKILQKF